MSESFATHREAGSEKARTKLVRYLLPRCERVVQTLLLGTLTLVSSSAAAEDGPGRADWGLPGVVRVGLAGGGQASVTGAADAGYGFTESQLDDVNAHHRVLGSLAAGIVATEWFAASLRGDGRYDWHPAKSGPTDSGVTTEPRLLLRLGSVVGESLHLGGEVSVWVPGGEAPSFEFGASTVDASLLAGWVGGSGLTIASRAGFRLDNSAKSVEDLDRYSAPDRVALGVSDFHAILVGVGISQRFADTELLLETTGDVLVGSDAPGFTESPLRASAGMRQHLSDALQIGLIVDAALSSRPPSGTDDPLVPIEPRIAGRLALSYTLGLSEPTAAPQPEPEPEAEPEAKPKPKPQPEKPALPEKAELRGAVTDAVGTPIRDATVTVEIAGEKLEAKTDGQGVFVIADVPLGTAKVTISAQEFKPTETTVEVKPTTEPVQVSAQLESDLPAGQIRGMVRSFGGQPLNATVTIESLGKTVTTNQDGFFQIDVEPGTYQVTVSAEGYVGQQRTLRVTEGGVVVFNADLVKKR